MYILELSIAVIMKKIKTYFKQKKIKQWYSSRAAKNEIKAKLTLGAYDSPAHSRKKEGEKKKKN